MVGGGVIIAFWMYPGVGELRTETTKPNTQTSLKMLSKSPIFQNPHSTAVVYHP
jgi:hypothetical protein